MKKTGILFPALFILALSNVNGQVYFDNLYGELPSADGIPTDGTIRISNGYLILSSQYNGQQNHYGFIVDVTGVELNGFYFENSDTISEQGGVVRQLNDSTYVVMSQWKNLSQSSDGIGDLMLTGFNGDGTVYWRRTYGIETRGEYPISIVVCSDQSIAAVGQVVNMNGTDSDGQMYLVSIDSLGNVKWEKEFGGTNHDSGTSLVQTPDSGFLLLGWTRSFGAGQRDFYLVKTDSVGNQEWYKTYGGSGNEGGQSMMQLVDGNYLLVGGSSPDGVTSHGRLYKIDSEGTVIWTENYSMQNGNSLFKTVELPDGSLVSAGLTTTSGESNAGYLIKTDSQGTLLWQRKYNKSNSVDLFYSILATDDGGFLLSGQANDVTGNQDAWLLKVDSVGCPYPNCTVGVDEVETGKVVVDVWPNPASEVVNVQLQQPGRAQITIIDMAGRSYFPPVVERSGVVGPYMQYDVSALPNGVYVFSVVQTEMKTSLKIMVQH